MYNGNAAKKITVIGLGQMGKKIAEMYVQRHYEVTVWNRSLEKAKQVESAIIAGDAEEALAKSPVSIICVHDNTAVEEIFTNIRSKEVFGGKSIINFTTGSPIEVKKLESWVNARKAIYLNGAIQVAPDQMGLPNTTILMGGNPEGFKFCKDDLSVLGGNIKFLGGQASSSPAMDMATLSWLYGTYIGLIYGAALCQQEGIRLEDYRDIIGEISPDFLEFFKHEINVIRKDDFTVTQSPLSISVTASRRIADTAKAIGLDSTFTDAIAGLLYKAKARGYEAEEVAAVIKVVRQ